MEKTNTQLYNYDSVVVPNNNQINIWLNQGYV